MNPEDDDFILTKVVSNFTATKKIPLHPVSMYMNEFKSECTDTIESRS